MHTPKNTECLWIGCDRAPTRRGICSRHYQHTLAVGKRASRPVPATVPERLDELAHLLRGGEWPARAARRCDWTLASAMAAARVHGRDDVLDALVWESGFAEAAA